MACHYLEGNNEISYNPVQQRLAMDNYRDIVSWLCDAGAVSQRREWRGHGKEV